MQKDNNVKKFGPITERRDYSKTVHNLEVPDLVATQKETFKKFLKSGIQEAIDTVYPIKSANGRIEVNFIPETLRLEKAKSEFKSVKQAKQKGITHGFKIYATNKTGLSIEAESENVDKNTGASSLHAEVLFGEIPLMTSGGSFVINGSEKVITAQLLRSPGAYFNESSSKGGDKILAKLEMIPKLGV